MNKRKAGGMSLAVLGIIFVVYNLFVFLLCKPQTSAFWISYGFMLIAFASQVFAMFASVKTLDVETVFFGIPLMQLSVFYFFAELFASAVFMFFQNFLSFKIPLLIQTALLAAFAIVGIMAVAGRDATKAAKDNIQTKVSALKSMGVDVEMMAGAAQDAELRSRLKKLAESIRYSDPMSTPAIEDVELRIRQAVNELRVYCENGDKQSAADTISRLELMIIERNKKLMLSK